MSTQTTPVRTTASVPRNPLASQNGLQPTRDILEYVKEYAREKPDVAALWCFGIGFVAGWKLKLW